MVSLCVGVFAGRNLKTSWFQPLFAAVLFVLGTWLVFDMGERAFILYAAIYAMLGYMAALTAWLLGKR